MVFIFSVLEISPNKPIHLPNPPIFPILSYILPYILYTIFYLISILFLLSFYYNRNNNHLLFLNSFRILNRLEPLIYKGLQVFLR